ncbi:MAG: acyl-CoA dehydratase activase-related protein, partial [Coriobacteriales bacterium]
IWLSDGIVTNIVVNEACSSGCGSFLEGFAKSLNIAVEDIADAAFSSTDPAKLGSRCTVFMNSSVVTEQKNGKTPADIMAGLCRSIIENVFTKVIRVSNLDSLGNNIVVQGGTFENDAVLAAFEDYVGRPVTRAPHPGLMGAIGAALSARQHAQKMRAARGLFSSSFIGFDALDDFSFEQQSNLVCPLCGNHCARTLVRFSDGSEFVTGNRCERGTVIGDVRDEETRARLKEIAADQKKVPNLFATRERLLFADYPVKPLCPDRGIVVGLPRVLALWEFAPFWTTLLRALGFSLRLSHLSTRKMYENGLSAVTSDTVCFPAKLVHGHIRDLVEQGVDRIFMPEVTTIKSENTEKTSESMCAVVKGYPMVIRNSDSPERRFGVPFDDPLFHWHTDEDKKRQLSSWLDEKWGIDEDTVLAALAQADAAQAQFKNELAAEGERVLDQVRAQGGYAIVLASRPYHNDPLVNHDLPEMLTSLGIPVLTPDAVPGVNEVDLSMSLIDIVNNFHARMLGSAVVAANDPALEYVQVVSFGCGHDAYLSDEIVRLMREISGKSPLVLKVDESDATGPLRIRVRSFVETIERKRSRLRAVGEMPEPRKLEDPYPAKFSKADRKKRTLLVPNTSHAFSRVMAAIFSKEGIDAVPLPVGRERAIELGKKYVHNDICFPAQIVIGEALAELETGKYDDDEVAIGMAKYIGDCRLTHYAALLRKALDDSGHATVPIVTNDDVDYHNMHPGYTFSLSAAIRTAMVLPMIDALEELLRKTRPYELEEGSADAAFERAMDILVEGLSEHGARGAQRAFAKSIEVMKGIAYDRSKPRPTVLIVGEYLLNFHPGANREIERYLESNGFEIIEARMTDVIRKTYFYMDAQVKEYDINVPRRQAAWYAIANRLFEHAHDVCDRIAAEHPLYEPPTRMPELVEASDPIIHHTFDAGEGVLIPAEILHNAKRGCRNFLILQPFGCLPNHVVGRGISKRLKELYPDAQILPLDYDPDVSFANLENRLQMLIMNARANEPEQTDSNGTLGKGGQGEPHARLSDVIELPTANKVPDSLAACMAAVADLNRVIEKQATLFRSAITEDFIAQALYLLKHVDDVKAAADRIVQHSAHLKEQTERIGTEMLEQLKGSSQRDDTAHRADDIVSSARELAHLTDIEAKLYAKTVSRRADIIHGMGERALRHSSDKAHELRSEGIDLAEQLAEQASELQERAKRVSREAALIA